MPEAQAGLIYQQTSLGNFINPATLSPTYRISNIEVTVDGDNPDLLITKVSFPSDLKADSFVPYSTNPLLRIKIFKKWSEGSPIDGNYGDVWIDSPKVRYPYQNNQLPVQVSSSRTVGGSPYDPRVDLTGCGAKSWIDPSGLNSWIKFSVSMSCVRLPDKFWVTAFVDADLNTNYQTDFKFAPLTPMLVDLTGISRPRAKDTQSIVISQVGTVDLRTTSISVAASAQRVNLFGELVAANPINYSSLTPLVCSFPNSHQNLLLLSTKGLCTVEAFASSDATANESNRAQMSFTVNPIPMQTQTFTFYGPGKVSEGDADFELNIMASSGLPIVLKSYDASVCYFKDPTNNPRLVSIVGPGYCDFLISQAGNERYYQTTGRAGFDVLEKYVPTPESTKGSSASGSKPQGSKEQTFAGSSTTTGGSTTVITQEKTDALAAKGKSQVTITCKTIKKPTKIMKVTGSKPKCPTNYKESK